MAKKSTKKPAAKKAAAKKTKPAKKRAKVASTETVKAPAPAPVANTSSADTSDENAELDWLRYGPVPPLSRSRRTVPLPAA